VLLEQFGTRGADDQTEALLAEAQGALFAALPAEEMDLDVPESAEQAQRRWREQLATWRTEAEVRCEPRIRALVLEQLANADGIAQQAAQGSGSLAGRVASWMARCGASRQRGPAMS
jgi:hypothetical protein